MNFYLAPVNFSDDNLLIQLIPAINELLETNINIIKLPLDLSFSFDSLRKQYYSTRILEKAIELTPEFEGKVLIITDVDLYVPVLTFIFGEAQLNGKHSIVSVCRLHEEFYTGITDFNLLLMRTKKEVLHELGHNFGLLHCLDWDCVMHSSNGIEEVDIKGDSFCSHCFSEVKKQIV